MTLHNVFRFRQMPEDATAKPFLAHLEDLRRTLGKMAITVMITMAGCFGFRRSLAQIMQRPLREIDPTVAHCVRSASPIR